MSTGAVCRFWSGSTPSAHLFYFHKNFLYNICVRKKKKLTNRPRKGGKPMARYKGMFERYLEAAERTGDIMLRYYFQKEAMRE